MSWFEHCRLLAFGGLEVQHLIMRSKIEQVKLKTAEQIEMKQGTEIETRIEKEIKMEMTE